MAKPKVATNRPASFGGSLVYAEKWIKPAKGSKTDAKFSVAYMGETKPAFVDGSDRTADPSLAQARVSDMDGRDFGREHTSYLPGSIHSRSGKSNRSSRRRRKVSVVHSLVFGRERRDENCSMVRPPVRETRHFDRQERKANRPRLVR